jgi:hypothetical protein
MSTKTINNSNSVRSTHRKFSITWLLTESRQIKLCNIQRILPALPGYTGAPFSDIPRFREERWFGFGDVIKYILIQMDADDWFGKREPRNGGAGCPIPSQYCQSRTYSNKNLSSLSKFFSSHQNPPIPKHSCRPKTLKSCAAGPMVPKLCSGPSGHIQPIGIYPTYRTYPTYHPNPTYRTYPTYRIYRNQNLSSFSEFLSSS